MSEAKCIIEVMLPPAPLESPASSLVCDDQGRPLRLYHGTGAVFDRFDLRFAPHGFWFTDDRNVASRVSLSPHARSVGGIANVRVAFLVMRRPLVVSKLHSLEMESVMVQDRRNDFDGIIWNPPDMVDDWGVFAQYVVFRPEQVLPAFEPIAVG